MCVSDVVCKGSMVSPVDFGLLGNAGEKEEPAKKPDLCLELTSSGPSDKDAAVERIESRPCHGDDCKTNSAGKDNRGEGSYTDHDMEMELCIELACIRSVGEVTDADDAKHAEKAKMEGKVSCMDCLCIELTCIRSVGEDADADDAKHTEKAKMRGKGSCMDCLAQEVCVRPPEMDADVEKIGPRPSHVGKYATTSVEKAYRGREGYCPECGVKIDVCVELATVRSPKKDADKNGVAWAPSHEGSCNDCGLEMVSL